MHIINSIFTLIREGTVYIVLFYMLTKAKISVGDFAFYFGVITSFAIGLSGIIRSFNMLAWASNFVTHYRQYLDTEEVFNHGKGCPLPADDEIPVEIEFRGVFYKYSSAAEPTIKDLNLKINKGEKIAIVGENGAGKTTIVKMLCGIYYPTEGDILINGKSIKDYNIKDYYPMFSVVFQDIQLLPISIAEFIYSVDYGGGVDYEKIERLIKEVGLYDVENVIRGKGYFARHYKKQHN